MRSHHGEHIALLFLLLCLYLSFLLHFLVSLLFLFSFVYLYLSFLLSFRRGVPFFFCLFPSFLRFWAPFVCSLIFSSLSFASSPHAYLWASEVCLRCAPTYPHLRSRACSLSLVGGKGVESRLHRRPLHRPRPRLCFDFAFSLW